MNKTNKKIDNISIFVYDSILISEEIIIEIIIIKIAINGYPSFNGKELAKLREVLRVSLGNYADNFSEDDLREFGASMLYATAIVLKVKYLNKNNLI